MAFASRISTASLVGCGVTWAWCAKLQERVRRREPSSKSSKHVHTGSSCRSLKLNQATYSSRCNDKECFKPRHLDTRSRGFSRRNEGMDTACAFSPARDALPMPHHNRARNSCLHDVQPPTFRMPRTRIPPCIHGRCACAARGLPHFYPPWLPSAPTSVSHAYPVPRVFATL
ncbi:hypothetical protein FB451DRAFT_418112 [Mycena latifolia]|nr:hypothetical protein FB451DRAFT_418112 [Mycena latifolia]